VSVLNQKVLRDPSVLNCKEVSRFVSSDEFSDCGTLMRMRVRIHLIICRQCRRYAEQIRSIGRVAKTKMQSLAGDSESIARLEEAILKDALGATDESR